MSKHQKTADMSGLYTAAIRESFVKLNPRVLWKNPVIFVTAVVAALTTVLGLRDLGAGVPGAGTSLHIAAWLWLCVLFANFAEALAEGRGKARADTLRATKSETRVRLLSDPDESPDRATEVVSTALRPGQYVYVAAGEIIPTDGEAVRGVASVNESAITGESAPVIREAGGDRSGVTGGTTIVSDWLVVRITAEPGKSFLDRMIALVEGAERQKTPNEIALNILLVGLTLIFLFVVVTLPAFATFSGTTIPVIAGGAVRDADPDDHRRASFGHRHRRDGPPGEGERHRQIGTRGRGGRDVDTLLLDKTGTITFGNRMADALIPAPGVSLERLAGAAALASLADETPEGKSIVDKAREILGAVPAMPKGAEPVAFTAQTRLSGLDAEGKSFRKGATDAVIRLTGKTPPQPLATQVDAIARSGGTPLLVAEGTEILGAVHLKDIVKPGVRERFAELRAMGIRTVMITGDNPLTAAAIAAEAGVDDFMAEATPEMKLDLIRREQAGGRLVAMCGDGSNDAPALAQADVGVAMNAGTPAAKEAANLIDLDSDPIKLIEVVMVGKQLLISRGALTTFSIANDVAKYFAILPAIFVAAYPGLGVLNIMGLASPTSAILSAVIFNALILVALVPLALRGVQYRPATAAALLRRNLLIYGLGGLIVPFIGIKAIDLGLVALNLA
jgi:K+-transporting ATPase ATPase B chain